MSEIIEVDCDKLLQEHRAARNKTTTFMKGYAETLDSDDKDCIVAAMHELVEIRSASFITFLRFVKGLLQDAFNGVAYEPDVGKVDLNRVAFMAIGIAQKIKETDEAVSNEDFAPYCNAEDIASIEKLREECLNLLKKIAVMVGDEV